MIMTGLDHSPIGLEEIDLQTTNATNWVQLEEGLLLLAYVAWTTLRVKQAKEWEEPLLVLTLKSLRLLVTDFFLISMQLFIKF